ncbi:MAG: hypothetical protein AAGF57_09525 [Pseudomonadota bacterium]
MTTLIATSVVRGSQQGESHGGVYLVDLQRARVHQPIDWDTMDIDWQGRGWDRGLRGIAFDGDSVFIAASDELFEYDPQFNLRSSYRNAYLKHCHEICIYQRRLFLTSTGYDSLLGFDLDKKVFTWGLQISHERSGLRGNPFHPGRDKGPAPANRLHLNSVFANSKALYFSGLHSRGLYAYSGRYIDRLATLPEGTHNARPHRAGIVYNDTQRNAVMFAEPEGPRRVFAVPEYSPEDLEHAEADDSKIARQAFGRGLCTISDSLLAAGSSPSTITLHDLDSMKTTLSINLSMDVRNAIHGLEVWPFDTPATQVG